MEQDAAATRAVAKSRNRPHSRASTTSIHSAATQPTLDPKPTVDQLAFAESSLYPAQWMPNDHNGHAKDMGPAPQMSPEDMILQAATHMQSANHEFQMDGSINAAMGHHLAFHQHHAMTRHPLPAEHYGPTANFHERGGQIHDRDENEDDDSMTGVPGASRIMTRSSANNELEMRHLFNSNRHRNLQDVARELHGNERGPNSERTRQVFAMLWINTVCSKGKGSVPRGRVYANYASRCATERITVLNPASFGKLVRVLFPGLKTRRLGVRGESKYHYVNFSLVEDQPDVKNSQSPGPVPETRNLMQNFNVPSQPSAVGQSISHLPRVTGQDQLSIDSAKSLSALHSVYNHPQIDNLDSIPSTSNKTRLELAFPSPEDNAFEQSEPIALPLIQAYLPRGTDPDAAKSLSALYRSHCTSLIECMRYCKEKPFFHLYTSFLGTLTMPVQKLFSNSAIAPWIESCDIALYQRMMRILSSLTLQVLPKPVLGILRTIADRLVPHIRESFQGQPQHVIAAKEAPAVIFSALLDRALRVNLSAHAAANMLSNPANRDQMYLDWIQTVQVRKLAECVPTRAMDDVVNLLVMEIGDLLDPVCVPWEVESQSIYGDARTRSGQQSEIESGADSSGNNVLDKWVAFLGHLPSKFPYASHADIVWCVERIGTAVMRDLTIAQGKSFGTWWVTKTWVDEMICFMAEQGGFIKQKARQPISGPETSPQTTTQTAAAATMRQNGRSSLDHDELNLANVSQTQPGRAPFPPPSSNGQQALSIDTHDDSGIGIRTPEEDFPMDKFTFSGPDSSHAVLSEAELASGVGL